MRPVLVADSVTELGAAARGAVLVAGSHGGRIAAAYASRAGVHAVILNDAAVGRDEAGVSGLAALEQLGMAAAVVSHASARIGDGVDAMGRGVVSRANAIAARCGVVPGMSARDAAERLRTAPEPRGTLASAGEGRFLLREKPPQVWALDSVGLARAADAGRILVFGSHGALHGGREDSAIPVPALAAAFHDAGQPAEVMTRLPVLDARGIPAVTVSAASARIGDARSMWETGAISHANAAARALGARPGAPLAAFLGAAFPG
ncbi:MAG TPA: hypothetical protein VFV84_00335 [Burkholderiales bacterium]|nr:hypothetical protein [Burkholderiales bacterium]